MHVNDILYLQFIFQTWIRFPLSRNCHKALRFSENIAPHLYLFCIFNIAPFFLFVPFLMLPLYGPPFLPLRFLLYPHPVLLVVIVILFSPPLNFRIRQISTVTPKMTWHGDYCPTSPIIVLTQRTIKPCLTMFIQYFFPLFFFHLPYNSL